jgi:23S rRNA pseudouridine2605 synthase
MMTFTSQRYSNSSRTAPAKRSQSPKYKARSAAPAPLDWNSIMANEAKATEKRNAKATPRSSGSRPGAAETPSKPRRPSVEKPAADNLKQYYKTKRQSTLPKATSPEGGGVFHKKRPGHADAEAMPPQRLNKLVAQATTLSRRAVDSLIEQGKVTLNGRTVEELGTIVADPKKAIITVSGKPIRLHTRKRTIVINKSRDCLTTRRDPQKRRTVYDILPQEYHDLTPVGRLDRNSTGLLVLTNDGDLVQELTHPKHHLPKAYRVVLDRPVEDEERLANRFLEGIWFEDEKQFARAVEVIRVSPIEWGVVLESGMNRQVRRMFAACSYDVKSLKRIAIGGFEASGLMPGKWRELRFAEIQQLRKSVRRQEHHAQRHAVQVALLEKAEAAFPGLV